MKKEVGLGTRSELRQGSFAKMLYISVRRFSQRLGDLLVLS